jgi:hypothetical protein
MISDADTINSVYPICGMDVYPSGTVIVRRDCLYQGQRPKRGDISSLSRKSLFRLLFLVRETSIKLTSLLTLTYPAEYPGTGKVVKSHWNTLRLHLKQLFKCDVDYVWFLEFQKRGAPHLHVMLSHRVWPGLRQEVAIRWSKLVGKDPEMRYKVYRVHNHPTAWEDIRSDDGAAKYVAKYAAKWDQKLVPDDFSSVGRFWGASRGVKAGIPEPTRVELQEDELRGILHEDKHPAHAWDVVPKFIFSRNNSDAYYPNYFDRSSP